MALKSPPDKTFWNWFYEQDPEDQVSLAEAYGLDFQPVQRPVDPTKFVPCESECGNYRDAMAERVPYSYEAALAREDSDVDAFYGGHRTSRHLDREWHVPDVDLSPYTTPVIRIAG